MTGKFTPVCKEVTVTKYLASDGNAFDDKEDCVTHEAQISLRALFEDEASYGELTVEQAAQVVEKNAELIRDILTELGK